MGLPEQRLILLCWLGLFDHFDEYKAKTVQQEQLTTENTALVKQLAYVQTLPFLERLQ